MASVSDFARETCGPDGKTRVSIEQRYGGEVEYCQIDGNPLVVCAVYGHNKTLESGRAVNSAEADCVRDHATATGVFVSCGPTCIGNDVLTQLWENVDHYRWTPTYLANRAANEIASLRARIKTLEAATAK